MYTPQWGSSAHRASERRPLEDNQGTQTGAALQLDEQTKPASSGPQSVSVAQGSAQILPSDVQPPSTNTA